jgi:hypothetical protein
LKWLLCTDGAESLKTLLADGARNYGASQDLLLRWLFEKRQTDLASKLSKTDIGQLRIGAVESCCWISSEKLFITLLSKRCEPDKFEEKIVNAIVASHPSPHRLLLTKMRSAMERSGLDSEIDILRDSHIQAAWLDDFLNPEARDETSAIAGTVTRHWEAIGDSLREELIAFGTNLRAKYTGISLKQVMKQSGLREIDSKSYETLIRYNSYISTKPFDRGHLTTGHIFSLAHENTEKAEKTYSTAAPAGSISAPSKSTDVEYWMCLSPACDMVPGQKKRNSAVDTVEGSNEFIFFSAVRLHEIGLQTAVGKATENLCVFIKIFDSIHAFSILPNADAKNPPIWGQMIAKNFGKFDGVAKIVQLSRVTTCERQVRIQDVEAHVFSQLRSEYASNLLQKFGTQLTRPGLGMQFKSRN